MARSKRWRWVAALWAGRQVFRFLRWRHRRKRGQGERHYDIEVNLGKR